MADNRRVDLHTHSNFSDGTLTPTELVLAAKKAKLSAIALTDHNTTDGLKEFMEAGEKNDMITIPGCEFSTEHNGKEVHVVGLFFKEKYWAEVFRTAYSNARGEWIDTLFVICKNRTGAYT